MGVPPPTAGPGVCRRCHGPSAQGPECWCCREVGRLLAQDPGSGPGLVPLALCRPGDALHGVLRRYKDAPALSARRHHAGVLAEMLQAFLARHGSCLEQAVGPWDTLTLVPSTVRPPATGQAARPLDVVVSRVGELQGLYRLDLERGPGRARHLAPAPDAFRLAGSSAADTSPRRVLVLDDTWVTGARARSAAAALASAGAMVVAVVAIGRTVDPEAAPRLARWWERHASAPWSGRCCLGGCGAGTEPAAWPRQLCSNAVSG